MSGQNAATNGKFPINGAIAPTSDGIVSRFFGQNNHMLIEQIRNGKMDTRKDKSIDGPIIANRRAPRNDSAKLHNDVQVVLTALAPGSELSIADEADFGSDPYNSTGQHVVLKARQLGAE